MAKVCLHKGWVVTSEDLFTPMKAVPPGLEDKKIVTKAEANNKTKNDGGFPYGQGEERIRHEYEGDL